LWVYFVKNIIREDRMKYLFDIYYVMKLRKNIDTILKPMSGLYLKKRYSRKTKFLISTWGNYGNLTEKKRNIEYRFNYLCQRIKSDKNLSVWERSFLTMINSLIYSFLLDFFSRKYFFTNFPSLLSR
jgi:hypothetical protein